MDMERKLANNLLALTNLEVEIKERYEDDWLFQEVNLYKETMSFFIRQNNHQRAFKESEELVEFLISHLNF